MKLDSRREQLLRRTFLDYKQGAEFLLDPLILDRAEGLYYWTWRANGTSTPSVECLSLRSGIATHDWLPRSSGRWRK